MRYKAIEEEKWAAVMDEVTDQIMPILKEEGTVDERDAFNLFIGTMLVIMDRLFGYLPPEEQTNILTSCGTWFDLGLLMGRSPKKLVDIMEKVNPGIVKADFPDWLGPFIQSLTKGGK